MGTYARSLLKFNELLRFINIINTLGCIARARGFVLSVFRAMIQSMMPNSCILEVNIHASGFDLEARRSVVPVVPDEGESICKLEVSQSVYQRLLKRWHSIA